MRIHRRVCKKVESFYTIYHDPIHGCGNIWRMRIENGVMIRNYDSDSPCGNCNESYKCNLAFESQYTRSQIIFLGKETEI